MSEHEHGHRERPRPYIQQLLNEMSSAYVDTLRALNSGIANELRSAINVEKGPRLVLLQGGGLGQSVEDDLMKAGSGISDPNNPKYKDRPGYYFDQASHRWKATPKGEEPTEARRTKQEPNEGDDAVAGDEEDQAQKKPARERPAPKGHWAKDEAGNVRFIPEGVTDKRFKYKLSPEEVAELPKTLTAVIQQINPAILDMLGKDSGIEAGYFSTLQAAVARANIRGMDVAEAFHELYAESLFDPDDPDKSMEALLMESEELFSSMMEHYVSLSTRDAVRRAAKRSLERSQQESVDLKNLVDRQTKIIKGAAQKLLSGDIEDESLRQFAILHDLNLFAIPATTQEALAYVPPSIDDPELRDIEARKLRGLVFPNLVRFRKLLENADRLSFDQQLAVTCGRISAEILESVRQNGNEFSLDEYLSQVPDENAMQDLRNWQEQAGKKYTDKEWAKVTEKVIDTALQLRQFVDNKNADRDMVFSAFYHGQTNLQRVFQEKGELERLRKYEAEYQARIQAALAAQDDPNIEIDPVITKSLKEKYGPKGGLFSHQLKAVNWMLNAKQGILASGAGLGKTPMAVTFLSELIRKKKVKRGVIVVPETLVEQWAAEIEKFRPGSKVLALNLPGVDRRRLLDAIAADEVDAEFVIVPASTFERTQLQPETLERWEEAVKAWEDQTGRKAGAVRRAEIFEQEGLADRDPMCQSLRQMNGAFIFDEIHMGTQAQKDPSNMQHLMARVALRDREYKFGMSATPMTSDPEDFYHLLNLYSPGAAGESVEKFINRFVSFDRREDEDGNVKYEPRLHDKEDLRKAYEAIRPHVFFQSKVDEDIVADMTAKGSALPDLECANHTMNLNDEGFKERVMLHGDYYDTHKPWVRPDLTEDDMDDFRPDHVVEMELLKKGRSERVIRMQMGARKNRREARFLISPKLVDKDSKLPEPKIDEAIKITHAHFNDPKNSEAPVIMFCSVKDGLYYMKDKLTKPVSEGGMGLPEHLIEIYNGDEADLSKRGAIQDSVNAGKVKILLLGLQAGGTGLNLQGQKDKETGNYVGPNRMIFLDKPLTASDIEQAVGRSWRTGSKYSRVYMHALTLRDTLDMTRVDRAVRRGGTLESIATSLLPAEKVNDRITKMIARIVGSLDDMKEAWTHEKRQAEFKRMGLTTEEIPPMHKLKTFLANVDKEGFLNARRQRQLKELGEVQVKRELTVARVRFKAGDYTKDEYKRKLRAIAASFTEWSQLVDKASVERVLQFGGEGFEFKTDSEHVAQDKVGGLKGKDKSASNAQIKKNAQAVADLKVGELRIKKKKNPYQESSLPWAVYEALRRAQPKDYDSAVDAVVAFVANHNGVSKKSIKAKFAPKAEANFKKLWRDGLLMPGEIEDEEE